MFFHCVSGCHVAHLQLSRFVWLRVGVCDCCCCCLLFFLAIGIVFHCCDHLGHVWVYCLSLFLCLGRDSDDRHVRARVHSGAWRDTAKVSILFVVGSVILFVRKCY